MQRSFILVLLVFLLSAAAKPDKPAYRIYDRNGKPVSFKKMTDVLKTRELVFFGELHDNPIAHWLQYETTKELFRSGPLVLGAEMFEADNQWVLNAYLKDSIDGKGLDTLARLWKNYKTDYKPLVDFAKANRLEVIATNIPRRYASLVHKKGFEALQSLTEEEKAWIAPLPFPFDPELPAYKKILEMMGDHGSPSIVKAQASKDATMAHFIVRNLKENSIFIHFNGAYHSDYEEGIVWYVKKQKEGLKCATISTVTQADVHKLAKEHQGKADFIIVVDEQMTRTY